MAEIHTVSGSLWAAADPQRESEPPLVLIHGAGGSHLDWPAPLRRLKGASVIAYDLAGHGRSTAPLHQTIASHAADLIALLDAYELPSALLAGHSMGGAIALQAALDAPSRVRGLALISTGARLRVSRAILSAASDPPVLAQILRGLFWGKNVPEALKDAAEARIASADPALLAADFEACSAFDVRGRLGGIDAPTFVFCGSADVMTPPELSEGLLAGIPNAEAVFFQGAGHRLPDEQPQDLAQCLERWLQGFAQD